MLHVRIDTSNAAFDDGNCADKLKRILNEVADEAAAGLDHGKLYDSNGNAVGRWMYE